MTREWSELLKYTNGEDLVVEQVTTRENQVTIRGKFDLPPLSRLSFRDQVFIIAFLQSHGSITEMEKLFDISYPTVKNRLNAISRQLDFVDINISADRSEVLNQLDRGEISVDEALKKLRRES